MYIRQFMKRKSW